MREIKNKNLRKKVGNAGYALTQPSFRHYHKEIRLWNADALRWVNNIPLERWTKKFDEGRRWGHMTTNLIEPINNVFKDIWNLPITALVRETYFRLGSLFATRGEKWSRCYGPDNYSVKVEWKWWMRKLLKLKHMPLQSLTVIGTLLVQRKHMITTRGGQMEIIGSNWIDVGSTVTSFKPSVCLAPMSLRYVHMLAQTLSSIYPMFTKSYMFSMCTIIASWW